MNKFTIWNEISKLQDCIKGIEEVLEWKKEYLRELQQWWFTADVFEQKYLQDYMNEFSWNCLWYIWRERKKSDDKFLEKNWCGTNNELAMFLCSRLWWHYAEEEVKDVKAIKKYYKDFLDNN